MATVMALDFVDNEGIERRLPLMTPEEIGRFHYARNRRANGTDMFCLFCKAPAHLVEHRERRLMYVAHRPGHGSGACAYAGFFETTPSGMSLEHRMAAATIAASIDDLNHWTATTEHTVQTEAGNRRLDVYAWRDRQLQPWHNPKIHEVQLSRQGLHETILRTGEHFQALPTSSTIWWTPDKASITGELGLLGLVIDQAANRVVDRAYSAIEPELIPVQPTISEAARAIVRDTKSWALIPWRDEDTDEHCQILVPVSAASGIPAPSGLRSTIRAESDRVIETGCARKPVGSRRLPVERYELSERPVVPRAPRQEQERIDCPTCGENLPTFTLAVHGALVHPKATPNR